MTGVRHGGGETRGSRRECFGGEFGAEGGRSTICRRRWCLAGHCCWCCCCGSFWSSIRCRARRLGALANLAASLLVVVFGFLFVTVSARIVGIVGSSASPVSGMTIATLMATAAIFLVKGWTAPAFGALAITIGGIVCIAASNAGDTAQDLKTGYLIGATPWKQQLAIMIGVIVSVFSTWRDAERV